MSYFRYFFGFIAITLVSMPFSFAVTEAEMGTIINLAGKQRMLTQKMSKEALLIAKGVDAGGNKANLKNTAALFDKTLKGLLNGDGSLGLAKTSNPKVIKQLNKVSGLWAEFKKSVDAAAGGDTSGAVLGNIAKQNLKLLKNMNRAVKMLEDEAKAMGGAKMGAGMATTLNLAGKQRMLTQKMTKELLLVASGIDADKNKRNLKRTVTLFGQTLKGLLDGNKDLELSGTKDAAIRGQLGTVGKLWGEYKPLLDKVTSGDSNDVSGDVLAKAAKLNLPLLKEMNKAVGMYAKSVK